MDNKLEKRFNQQDINSTPKVILEDLFNYVDEHRCRYEEQEFDYRKKIRDLEKIIEGRKNELKDPGELTVNQIKGINEYIKDQKVDIEKCKKEIRLIHINCDILWKNELKMDKVLGYGLED